MQLGSPRSEEQPAKAPQQRFAPPLWQPLHTTCAQLATLCALLSASAMRHMQCMLCDPCPLTLFLGDDLVFWVALESSMHTQV